MTALPAARLARLWPRSLAGRLVVSLLAALVGAQVLLALVMRSQQDLVVAELVQGQALNQTVAFARLLQTRPPEEAQAIAEAFGSRDSCARLVPGVTMDRAMTDPEKALAGTLTAMLHGVQAGAPLVEISPIGPDQHPCDGSVRFGGAGDQRSGRGPGGRPADRSRTAAVAMSVPLADGRAIMVRTAVNVPTLSRSTVLSFLLSSLAVSLVALFAVRRQTRSLAALADASERFGRGETVAPLPVAGPDEVGAATAAFNTMQERLDAFLRDRLKLLAAIGHDLRTPLTALRLKAEFIEDETVRDDLVRTIDELTVICEETLAFARAETSTEPSRTVEARALVEDVAETFLASGSLVEILRVERVALTCRPVALKRALRNLVENAVRYGRGAALSVVRQDEGAVVFTVDDEGPGLPPERLEEAFEPFVRIEPSRSAETGGLGLGLAIARSIAKAHGGSLVLSNRPGGGLRAELRLPPGCIAAAP